MVQENKRPSKAEKIVLTFGTFDVFHIGHLRILERAASLGHRLVVGVSTDALNYSKKAKNPIYPESERMRIVAALKCVDEVFLERGLEFKREYLMEHKADVLVMGHDWKGKFDEFQDIVDVEYFQRTPSISTTEIIEKIRI